jgi:hypothetical protein
MLRIPSPVGPPTTITLVFRSPIFGQDLTDVSAVNLDVRRQNGTTAVWACDIISATPLEMVVQYALQTGDISGTGLYMIQPQLTVSGGTIPSQAVAAFVGTYPTPKLEDDVWLATTATVTTGGPVAQGWQVVTTSPIAATAKHPFLAIDLRTIAVSVTLWAATDGDVAILSDVYSQAATHNLTLNGEGTSKVPVGDGTYASSTVYNASFMLRLRYSSALDLWIPW